MGGGAPTLPLRGASTPCASASMGRAWARPPGQSAGTVPRELARSPCTRLYCALTAQQGRRRAFFQVFADAYERQSVVITTNLEFSRWGGVFGDDQMAAAVIDRVVHHGRLVQFRGESYRVRHALMQEGQVLKILCSDRLRNLVNF